MQIRLERARLFLVRPMRANQALALISFAPVCSAFGFTGSPAQPTYEYVFLEGCDEQNTPITSSSSCSGGRYTWAWEQFNGLSWEECAAKCNTYEGLDPKGSSMLPCEVFTYGALSPLRPGRDYTECHVGPAPPDYVVKGSISKPFGIYVRADA